MPRTSRDDLEPEILLPDTLEQQRLAAGAIDDTQYGVQVYPRHQSIGREPRMYIFNNRLNVRLRECREYNNKVNEGLLLFMMLHCDLADVREKRDKNGVLVIVDGSIVNRLVRVGCRIHMTQVKIADQYGVTRPYVNRQISILKDWYFIVNSGNGWYEFDASLCWCGNLTYCAAYREVQRARDGLVITDGNGSVITTDVE